MVHVDRANPGADTFEQEDVAELGLAEEDLQETKEQFRILAECALTGIYLIQDDRFRYVNPAAAKMFGYTAAEVVNNLSPLDIVHPADRPLAAENLRRRINGELEEAQYQFRGLRKDGSSFPVLVHGRSIQFAGKIGVMGTLVDNSDIQRAMDKLRESEARSEEMQRLAHAGWWEADFRTDRMSLSDEVCRSFGVQPGDLPAWRGRWLELVHPEDRRRAAEAAAAAVRGGPRLDVEYRVVRPDGAVRIVHIRGDVTRDESGRPLRHFGVLQDITELRQAEDEVRASEERFRTLVQFSFDVYWETDAEHRFIRQEYVRDFADMPAPGAEIGKTRWEVPYLEPDEEAWRRHRETLDAHLPFRDFEHIRPTADGGKRYTSVSGLPVFDQTGRFVGYRGVGRLTTAQKRAEAALREMQGQLAHANRVATLGQLTASIAHEVNQPIAATLANAQAALRWLSSAQPNLEEVRDALDRIVRDAGRAGDVVQQIRNLGKRASQRQDRLETNAVIREVVELAHNETLKNGVSVKTQLVEGLPLVRANRVELQQVILNLIVNAIEAMSSGDRPRELLIRSGKNDASEVFVSVCDTGPGLSSGDQDALFKPFHTTKPNGLGLGLSICRSIIEGHGGRLWASANVPRGAVFQFTLPV